MSVFSENLRSIRKERNLTQDSLAELVHTSKQVLSRYENGMRIPKISMVEKLADALNVSITELTGDDAPDNSEFSPDTPEPQRRKWRMISAGTLTMSDEELDRFYQVARAMHPEKFPPVE